MTPSDRIRQRARELGFDKVGIAPARSPAAASFLRQWLDRGYHGSMAYMARDPEKRMDPRRILEGARSVVVVALNYHVPRPRIPGPLEGVVSSYAWGRDYHEVMTERLHELRRFIESLGGRAKVAVDTSPVLEKIWAAQAGLGWQGKHSNLITKDLASWVFLGEVVTDLVLEPDAPFRRDHCGTCTRCIDLCPTGAIVAPYVVDARRCIAYLTIEYRGIIPRELRPAIGNMIFGCDICQEVCPWNRFARRADDPAFQPREDLVAPPLAAWATISQQEFRRLFRHSPIRRAGRAGFARNVVIALGNSGDPRAAAPLARALEDHDPVVRAHAAWALGRIGTPQALEHLRRRAAVETDRVVEEEIAVALTGGPPEPQMPPTRHRSPPHGSPPSRPPESAPPPALTEIPAETLAGGAGGPP